MKRIYWAFLFATGLGWAPLWAVDDPDVGDFGFGQVKRHTQTGAGVVNAQANPYAFHVFVSGDGGNINNGTISVPGPSAATYNISGNSEYRFGDSYLSPGYASATQLDSVFPRSGGYSMSFETPLNASGYTINSLGLGGGIFPSVPPELTGGGTWSGGNLLVDVLNESNYLTFNSFTGMNAGTDYIIFDLWSTTDYRALTSSSQYDGSNFYIGPDQSTHVPYLVVGDTYQASITFLKVVGTDASTVPTENSEIGYSFMAYRTYFTVQAVPEPSTYALLAAGLGLVGWRQWRRRR